jgi:hypothetical protein
MHRRFEPARERVRLIKRDMRRSEAYCRYLDIGARWNPMTPLARLSPAAGVLPHCGTLFPNVYRHPAMHPASSAYYRGVCLSR